MEKTRQELAAYFRVLNVPNWEPRLETKTPDYLFELGVYIQTPALEKQNIETLRGIMDMLLNFSSMDEALAEIEKQHAAKVFTGKIIHIVLAPRSEVNHLPGVDDNTEAFKAQVAAAANKTTNEKIAHLLEIARVLGKGKDLPKYYDAAYDLSKRNPEYFNFCYALLMENMRDGHHRECECVSMAYDAYLFSDSEKEAVEKLSTQINC